MAVFKEINQQIKARYPDLDIEVCRGSGYVYFSGNDGFDKIPSVYTNPTTTSTEDVIDQCIDAIEEVQDYY